LEKVWGSTELEPWFPRSQTKIGEVWFAEKDQLPVLMKFLFTSEKLSVQVHPKGKTEMWHILRAEPGARIALGFLEPLSRDRLREAAQSGEIEHLLRWFPVKAGETYFAAANTVHAIGAGLALCEIQQYSDVTYRLYDYGRPRELHLDAAVAVSDLGCHPGPSLPVQRAPGRQLLVHCEYFETELLTPPGPGWAIETDTPALLILIEGSGVIAGETVRPGQVWLVPQGSLRLERLQRPFRALWVRGPRP
jgi:mannose-6-phosphate isomerase